ncbi:MAG TPA: hypothetical protein VEN47_08775 [Myxococcota bacterium]|nr:hypothetical protein [Myxococcota bacterium]
MTRVAALALAAALAALCACGKYGPPVRPRPTPAHGSQNAPVPPAPVPDEPDTLPAPEPQAPDPQAPQATQPQSSNTEQCDDPNAAPVGAKP